MAKLLAPCRSVLWRIQSQRPIHYSIVQMASEIDKVPKPVDSQPQQPVHPMDIGIIKHKVVGMERRFLVWSGHYKRIEDVPEFVSETTMQRSTVKARIRVCNYMMLAAALGSLIMVYSGKEAAKRGESVHKMNLDWHKEINRQAKLEAANAASK